MRTLKDLLPQKRYQDTKTTLLDEKTVFYAFEKVVLELYGMKGKENILPERFLDGKLFVCVRSSLWFNELELEKTILLQKLALFLSTDQIRELRLKRG